MTISTDIIDVATTMIISFNGALDIWFRPWTGWISGQILLSSKYPKLASNRQFTIWQISDLTRNCFVIQPERQKQVSMLNCILKMTKYPIQNIF